MHETTYTPRQLAKLLSVTTETLRQWESRGIIKTTKTAGGHRRYIYEKQQSGTSSESGKTNYIYARVSSAKQKNDLERQIASLQSRYPGFEVIKDIGSGINFKRPGLKSLLESIFEGNVSKVVVAHRDRLSRFGFELFMYIFTRFGVQLEVVGSEDVQEPHDILINDIMSIVTVFTARYYGSRKYNVLQKAKNLSKSRTKNSVQKMPRRFKIRI